MIINNLIIFRLIKSIFLKLNRILDLYIYYKISLENFKFFW